MRNLSTQVYSRMVTITASEISQFCIRTFASSPVTMLHPRYSVPFLSSMLLPMVMITISFQVIADITATDNDFNHSSIFQPTQSIYYDLASHQQLEITMDDSNRLPVQSYKFSSRGMPCDCYNLTCECCTGMKFGSLDLNKTCAKAIVIPEQFSIQLLLHMNGKVLMRHTLSGKNPPPVCSPLPLLPLPIKLCIRFYNIRVVKNLIMVCINFEIKTDNWSVFILHFDCLNISISNGPSIAWVDHPDKIQFTKPVGDINNVTVSQSITTTESEVYDEVTFESSSSEAVIGNSTLNPISEYDEDQIGTLKF